METPNLLTVNEFCQRFRVSRASVYRMAAAGKLRLLKIGAATRISEAEAARWLQSLPVRGGGQ